MTVVIQSLSHVRLSATPWTAACLAPLSSTLSWSLLKFMSVESGMQSNHLILCRPFSFCFQSFPASESFPMSRHHVIKTIISYSFSTHKTGNFVKMIKPCLCCCCCEVASVMSDYVRPHRRQPTRLRRPWDSPGKNTGVGCHFLLQCMKVKPISRVRLLGTPWTAAHEAPPSMGFSRQEYWSAWPLPSLKPCLSCCVKIGSLVYQ